MAQGNVFNNTTYDLSSLIKDVNSGIIALPDLQRPFVWKQSQVRDLFDSIYKHLPTGLIILWKVDDNADFKPIGFNQSTTPNRLVIDGQQRLTSLYSVVMNKPILDKNFKEIKPKISFNPLTEEFEVFNISKEKDPEWIEDISLIFTGRIFDIIINYINNLKEKRPELEIDEHKIQDNITKIKEMDFYSFAVLELSSDLDPEEVSEIFVRINSQGKPLNQSDFILTLMSIYWPEGRDTLEEFSMNCIKEPNKKNSPYNIIKATPSPEDLLKSIVSYSFLRGKLKYAYLILKGRDLKNKVTTKEERIKNFETLKEGQEIALNLTNWHNYIRIIQQIGFINYKELVRSDNTFYAIYGLYLIGKNKFKIPQKELESIISKWFIFSQLTQRYTHSTETRIERDFANFRENNNFVEVLEQIMSSELTEDFWQITLPQRFVSSLSNNVERVYIASQIYADKNILFSKIKLRDYLRPDIKTQKKQIEKHHLFPKNYLIKQGLNKTEYNQRANFIYIEYYDNIKISDKSPEEYWPMMLEQLNKEEKKEIESNYTKYYDLPFEFWKMEYNEFLESRRQLMALSVKEYFEKL